MRQGDDLDPVPPANSEQPQANSRTPSRKRTPFRDGVAFFGNFLKNPTSIGAVLPSSRFLSRALVGSLDHLRDGELVVEFGPGTGPASAVIQQRLPRNARYLGIELQQEFHELLSDSFPDLDFHHGSAGDLQQILTDRGLPRPSRIISGLPFASLPVSVQDSVVDGLAWALKDSDCDFRTFQYVHAYQMKSARRFRARMAERFESFERIGPVVCNVPPAFILRYHGIR